MEVTPSTTSLPFGHQHPSKSVLGRNCQGVMMFDTSHTNTFEQSGQFSNWVLNDDEAFSVEDLEPWMLGCAIEDEDDHNSINNERRKSELTPSNVEHDTRQLVDGTIVNCTNTYDQPDAQSLTFTSLLHPHHPAYQCNGLGLELETFPIYEEPSPLTDNMEVVQQTYHDFRSIIRTTRESDSSTSTNQSWATCFSTDDTHRNSTSSNGSCNTDITESTISEESQSPILQSLNTSPSHNRDSTTSVFSNDSRLADLVASTPPRGRSRAASSISCDEDAECYLETNTRDSGVLEFERMLRLAEDKASLHEMDSEITIGNAQSYTEDFQQPQGTTDLPIIESVSELEEQKMIMFNNIRPRLKIESSEDHIAMAHATKELIKELEIILGEITTAKEDKVAGVVDDLGINHVPWSALQIQLQDRIAELQVELHKVLGVCQYEARNSHLRQQCILLEKFRGLVQEIQGRFTEKAQSYAAKCWPCDWDWSISNTVLRMEYLLQVQLEHEEDAYPPVWDIQLQQANLRIMQREATILHGMNHICGECDNGSEFTALEVWTMVDKITKVIKNYLCLATFAYRIVKRVEALRQRDYDIQRLDDYRSWLCVTDFNHLNQECSTRKRNIPKHKPEPESGVSNSQSCWDSSDDETVVPATKHDEEISPKTKNRSKSFRSRSETLLQTQWRAVTQPLKQGSWATGENAEFVEANARSKTPEPTSRQRRSSEKERMPTTPRTPGQFFTAMAKALLPSGKKVNVEL